MISTIYYSHLSKWRWPFSTFHTKHSTFQSVGEHETCIIDCKFPGLPLYAPYALLSPIDTHSILRARLCQTKGRARRSLRHYSSLSIYIYMTMWWWCSLSRRPIVVASVWTVCVYTTIYMEVCELPARFPWARKLFIEKSLPSFGAIVMYTYINIYILVRMGASRLGWVNHQFWVLNCSRGSCS